MTLLSEWADVIWVAATACGLVVNWVVMHKSMIDLARVELLGLNGPLQRDARWAYWQDRLLTGLQAVAFLGGIYRLTLDDAPESWPPINRMLISSIVVVIVSVGVALVGVGNLYLRREQVREEIARRQGKTHMHMRRTDLPEEEGA